METDWVSVWEIRSGVVITPFPDISGVSSWGGSRLLQPDIPSCFRMESSSLPPFLPLGSRLPGSWPTTVSLETFRPVTPNICQKCDGLVGCSPKSTSHHVRHVDWRCVCVCSKPLKAFRGLAFKSCRTSATSVKSSCLFFFVVGFLGLK